MTQGHTRLARPFKLGNFLWKLDFHSKNRESIIIPTLMIDLHSSRDDSKLKSCCTNSISFSCKIPMSSSRKMTPVKIVTESRWQNSYKIHICYNCNPKFLGVSPHLKSYLCPAWVNFKKFLARSKNLYEWWWESYQILKSHISGEWVVRCESCTIIDHPLLPYIKITPWKIINHCMLEPKCFPNKSPKKQIHYSISDIIGG